MGKYDHLEIDDELHEGLPKLSKEEFAQLKANIVKDGKITDPVIVWGDVVVDGRHRVQISRETGIEFAVDHKNFTDNDEAKDWIINRALGQRNVSIERRKILLGQLYINRKRAAAAASATTGDAESNGKKPGKTSTKPAGQNDQRRTDATADAIATEYGVSEKTVRRAVEFVTATKDMPEAVREAVISQEVKATQAQVKQLAALPAADQKKVVAAVTKGEAKNLAEALPKRGKAQGASVRKSTASGVIKAYGGLVRALDKAGMASKDKSHFEKSLERLNKIHDQQFVPWLLEEFGFEVKKAGAAA